MSPFPIDAVIFDFGGVFLDIDYGATTRALISLSNGQLVYDQTMQTEVFDQLERGEIDESSFRDWFRRVTKQTVSDGEIDQAWNAMLGELPKERLEVLNQIRANKRVFLLSNTNSIHKKAFDKTLDRFCGIGVFNELFEAAYYSHLIGFRKPEAQSYQYIIERHQLNPARTLFIDDSIKNIEGAASVGLLTCHLQMDLCQWYSKEGLLLLN